MSDQKTRSVLIPDRLDRQAEELEQLRRAVEAMGGTLLLLLSRVDALHARFDLIAGQGLRYG